jgi:hypothetical protein
MRPAQSVTPGEHAGLDQQHQQEPVPEVLARLDQGQDLPFVEGAGQVPALA